MIRFGEAYQKVQRNALRRGIVLVPISKAVGSVLAKDIRSDLDMPPFNKSAMDGFAVKSRDVGTVPVCLKCAGEVKAGTTAGQRLRAGECARIMTGAPLPPGADAVVMVEYTKEMKGVVNILKGARAWENVCLKGEDFRRGKIVLKKGAVIRSPEMALLASVGCEKVFVYRAPSVAVLSTGDEIVEPEVKPKPGQIRDSNRIMLLSLAHGDGGNVSDLGIVLDEIRSLRTRINKGLQSDIFLISGGVSEGDYDFVPDVLKGLGVRRIFHKVAQKPGKPLWFGRRGNTLVFGLPGNPISSFLTYRLYVRPALRKMKGESSLDLSPFVGQVERDIKRKKGRLNFVPVYARLKNGKWLLTPVIYHGSADIHSLQHANAFAMVPSEKEKIKRGENINFILF